MPIHSSLLGRRTGRVTLRVAEVLCCNHTKGQGLVPDATVDPTILNSVVSKHSTQENKISTTLNHHTWDQKMLFIHSGQSQLTGY